MFNDEPPPIESPPTPDSPRRFRDESLLVLLTVAAVAGIALINLQREPRSAASAPAAPLEACADCGEVIGIHDSGIHDSAAGDNSGGNASASAADASSSDAQIVVDVRMRDGSLRTIKQSARNVGIGDHVRVNGNALSSRS